VGKVVQFDRQRYGDEISLWIFLQVRQIVVQGVILPFIAVSNEAPKCVVARRRTGADPPRRLRPDDLGKPGSSATHVVFIFLGSQRRGNKILGVPMRDDPATLGAIPARSPAKSTT
jgi:hypothetical protein